MPKGKPKGGHKGRMRRFVTEEEIADQEEKKKREQEWKKKKGLSSNIDRDKDSEEEDDAITAKEKSGGDDDVSFSRGASGGRGLEEEEESSEEEDSSDDEYNPKSKGVEGLIEIENPNRVQQKGRKVQHLDVNAKVELSRREREEIQKQKDATNYRKKHEAGQTEEARRDLARLALIRQQREDAAKKKEMAKKVEASKK